MSSDAILILFCIVWGLPLLVFALMGMDLLPDVEFLYWFIWLFFLGGNFLGICVEQAKNKLDKE